MTIFDHLLPLVYKPLWGLADMLHKATAVMFYVADPLDYAMFQPIRKHLDMDIHYVAKNAKSRAFLRQQNIPYKIYPAFPRAVIMGRHAAYKFPEKKIAKIGFDHGLYQFKRWTRAKYYNQFDIYFVSSENQVQAARQRGITTVRAVGYPKIDKMFDGSISRENLASLRQKLNLQPEKATVVFTSTWDVGGLSALTKWVDRVHELTPRYNILLTAHPWTKKTLLQKLKNIPGAFYLPEADVSPYLMLADVFVGDYNSLIGEFCALDKPIITFRTPSSERSVAAVRELIAEISDQVDTFDEVPAAIEQCLHHPRARSDARQKANRLLYKALDGKAGERAAQAIRELITDASS